MPGDVQVDETRVSGQSNAAYGEAIASVKTPRATVAKSMWSLHPGRSFRRKHDQAALRAC